MIGADIFSLLRANSAVVALVGDRIYPLVRPQGSALPAIVFTVVDDLPVNSLGGATSGLVDALVQFDCYAKTYVSAHAVAKAVSDMLSKRVADPAAVRQAKRDGYEDETELYRVSMDFSMWMKEA